MVYWEHEEGGSNPGYHFSYIGFENGVRKDGSSLCTAHDDGGKITAYGYGYYWSKGETEPLLETQHIALDGRNTEAAAELEKQMPQFSFVTYQTSDTACGSSAAPPATATGSCLRGMCGSPTPSVPSSQSPMPSPPSAPVLPAAPPA